MPSIDRYMARLIALPLFSTLIIAAMLLIVAALTMFLIEVHLAARTIRVRDEVLFHEVDEQRCEH